MPRPYLRQLNMGGEREQPFVEVRANGGLNTQLDSADIENNEFVRTTNFDVRDDITTRRKGTTIFAPAKPNNEAVLLVQEIKEFDGTTRIVRVSETAVHRVNWVAGVIAGAWTQITGPALNADDTARAKLLRLDDRTFLAEANTGIYEINFTTDTYALAGNAPKARYIAGFFNRLVCAYYTDPLDINPVKIGWSGDNNFDEFNPLVDYSSGFTFLLESPADSSDFIMGLIPMANSMIIMKQRSIWMATKQPSASNPFNFFTVVPGIGCDCPESIQKIPNGIVWYDSRIGTVYVYLVGMQAPEVIGYKIANNLLAGIPDPNHCNSTYDALNEEYTLCLSPYGGGWPTAGTATLWKYNFRNKSWTYHEIQDITQISHIESVNTRYRMYGQYDGDILYDPHQHFVPATYDTDNGLAYTSTLTSKTYEMPSDDSYIHSLRIEYRPLLAGSFTVSYSKDNGTTWVAYKTISFLLADVGKRKIARFTKHIKARQYTWKLVSTSGLFDVIQFVGHVYPGATSKE